MAPAPPLERFLDKIEVDENGCWRWQAHITKNGYGQLGVAGSVVYAHRFSYENFRGPIPSGLQLDHLCRVRHCVNPDHLEPVTQRENIMRGAGYSARAAAATHCPQGHPYSGENLYLYRGGRRCRACWPIHHAWQRAQRRDEINAAKRRAYALKRHAGTPFR